MKTKIVVLCKVDYTDRPELPDVVYVEYGNGVGIPIIRELDREFNLVLVPIGSGLMIVWHILDSLKSNTKYTVPAFCYDNPDSFTNCDDGTYVVFREPADTTHMVNIARYCLTDLV